MTDFQTQVPTADLTGIEDTDELVVYRRGPSSEHGITGANLFGTTANRATRGNDSRLSDPRTPTAHEPSHRAGSADALTNAIGSGTPNGTLFLRDDMTWASAGGGGGGTPGGAVNSIQFNDAGAFGGVWTYTSNDMDFGTDTFTQDGVTFDMSLVPNSNYLRKNAGGTGIEGVAGAIGFTPATITDGQTMANGGYYVLSTAGNVSLPPVSEGASITLQNTSGADCIVTADGAEEIVPYTGGAAGATVTVPTAEASHFVGLGGQWQEA